MDRLIQITTATAVATVAAVISYRHAYELVSAGEHSDIDKRHPNPE